MTTTLETTATTPMTNATTNATTNGETRGERTVSADRLIGLLVCLLGVHRRELVELAARADELADNPRLGRPWTITPGTDALVSLHPHLVLDFTQDPPPRAPASRPASSPHTPR